MAEIPLSNGGVAIVDDADVALVSGHRWYAAKNGRNTYAFSTTRPPVPMHRLILGAPAGVQIDHGDGDGLNNRRSNIRTATSTQQRQNQRKRAGAKWSAHKGVSFFPPRPSRPSGGWVASIKINGRRIRRYASSEIEAARIYNDLAREHFGEFARLNAV